MDPGYLSLGRGFPTFPAPSQCPGAVAPAAPPPGPVPSSDQVAKAAVVRRLLIAKEYSGKTFSQIAEEVGITNVYCAQLFHLQQQLQPNTVAALKKAVPHLSYEDITLMQRAPCRRFEPEILQEPAVYRLYEAIAHGGESIKAIINEDFGDGIMSAINFSCSVQKRVVSDHEQRVIITFDGKFLPYTEQRTR